MSRNASFKTRLMVANATVMSIFCYMISVWGGDRGFHYFSSSGHPKPSSTNCHKKRLVHKSENSIKGDKLVKYTPDDFLSYNLTNLASEENQKTRISQ